MLNTKTSTALGYQVSSDCVREHGVSREPPSLCEQSRGDPPTRLLPVVWETTVQPSRLENPRDGGPGGLQSVGSRSQTRLSDFPFTFHSHALQKEMAPHSSVLAWRIPGTEEPGGLPSLGSHRVGHD